MNAYRSRKPAHGHVAFGLLGIGAALPLAQDVRCCDCAHAHRMQAPAWRSCGIGHIPHRALEPHACDDWRPVETQP